jgi:hypothetical protein
MNIARARLLVTGGLISLAFVIATITGTALGSTLVDPTFDVLKTRTGTYTNVTVTTRADKYIFIQHSAGLSSVRVADLPPDALEELGYSIAVAPAPKQGKDLAKATARQLTTQVNQSLKPFEDALKQQWLAKRAALHIGSELFLTALGILAVLHLALCHLLNQICIKAKSPRSFLIWVPVAQLLPLLRAAGMSRWWVLLCIVPGLNVIAFVLWSVNIVKACGKSVVWTVLLIFPVTSLVAILYLAFSGSDPSCTAPPKPTSKFQTQSLQTA